MRLKCAIDCQRKFSSVRQVREGNRTFNVAPNRDRNVQWRQRGETITEVLVAMVIAGLALLMLATAIAAATNIISNSRQSMETYYKASNGLAEYSEQASAGGVTKMSGSVTVKVSGDTGTGATISLGGDGGTSVPITVYVSGADSNSPAASYVVDDNQGETGDTP